MKILLLEDDLMLKESIEEYLSQEYTVDSFENSDDAYDAIFSTDYDLLLLDVNVHGSWDGFALRRELCDEQMDIPTIFVTSMTSSDALLQGYKTGCCDYIKKPFELIELELRVRQALKVNCFHTHHAQIELGTNMVYDTSNYSLCVDGDEMRLSRGEREILNFFVIHRSQVVTLQMLCERLWDGDVDLANVRVQLNNLRRKLPEAVIKNIHGVGYQLDC